MKQFLNIFFVVMGVIFTILIVIGIYLFITDPWNIKPILFGGSTGMSIPKQQVQKATPVTTTESSGATTSTEMADAKTHSLTTDSSFTLSDKQKQALVSFGIDPVVVPSTISPEVEACFVVNLGASRVAEIKAGAVPGAIEFFKAKSCI